MAEVASPPLALCNDVQADVLDCVFRRSMLAMMNDQEFVQHLKSGQPVMVASLASLMANRNLKAEACDELRSRFEAASTLLSIYEVDACGGGGVSMLASSS